MTREQALDLLLLLSALESVLMADGKRVPDYLFDRLEEAVKVLKEEVMK